MHGSLTKSEKIKTGGILVQKDLKKIKEKKIEQLVSRNEFNDYFFIEFCELSQALF